jgi:hypothetical protein
MAAFLIDSLGEATLFDWLSLTTLAMILGPTLIATSESSPVEPSQSTNMRPL